MKVIIGTRARKREGGKKIYLYTKTKISIHNGKNKREIEKGEQSKQRT